MIKPPTHCPSCGSPLEIRNDQLYCISADCGDRKYKSIEHFCSTLKIKGLGPSNIRRLDLREFSDIYTTELPPGKTWENIGAEIEKSKQAPLNQVLPALGIPLIGQTAADKLSNVIESIDELTKEKCKEAGLGDKATENLMAWHFDRSLPFDFKFAKKSATNGVVCITGKLVSFKNKAEAIKVLEARGYAVKSTVTKEVTIVVNESGVETAKTQKARESGSIIITNLKDFLGE